MEIPVKAGDFLAVAQHTHCTPPFFFFTGFGSSSSVDESFSDPADESSSPSSPSLESVDESFSVDESATGATGGAGRTYFALTSGCHVDGPQATDAAKVSDSFDVHF